MRSIIEKCDGFVTPGEHTIELIKKHFHSDAHFCCVPHCIDKHNPRNANQYRDYIVHSGSLQKERIREELVEAIVELGIENKDFKGLIHIGAYSPKLTKIIKEYRCKNIILIGRIPEELAIRIQSLFETGIIIEIPMNEPNPFMPSKITDSIQLNKKIVAITPQKSFLTDFANQNDGIYCCSYEKSEIKKSITEALKSKEEISIEAINYFHPLLIAQSYNDFFNSLK